MKWNISLYFIFHPSIQTKWHKVQLLDSLQFLLCSVHQVSFFLLNSNSFKAGIGCNHQIQSVLLLIQLQLVVYIEQNPKIACFWIESVRTVKSHRQNTLKIRTCPPVHPSICHMISEFITEMVQLGESLTEDLFVSYSITGFSMMTVSSLWWP